MGYKDVPNFNTMKVIKADEPKKIVLTKLSRRTKILAYGTDTTYFRWTRLY